MTNGAPRLRTAAAFGVCCLTPSDLHSTAHETDYELNPIIGMLMKVNLPIMRADFKVVASHTCSPVKI